MMKPEDAIRILDLELTESHGDYRYQNPAKLDREEALFVAIKALQEKLDREQAWISVEDRLPQPFVSVLAYLPGEGPLPLVYEGFISKDGIWHVYLYDRKDGEVTHWMPMPEPPRAGEGEEG